MEDVLDDGTHYEGLQLTAESKMYLSETARWSKFLAIVGFVFTGLMVLLGIFFGSIMGTMMAGLPDEAGAAAMSGMGGLMSVVYVIIAALYFFPCYYLYKFANKTKLALATNDTQTLTEALKNHKSVYKFMGIFMIIILAFYGLALIGGLFAGAMF